MFMRVVLTLLKRTIRHEQVHRNFSTEKRDGIRLTDLLNDWTNKFHAEGISDSSSSAEYIIAFVLGRKTLHSVNKNDFILDEDDVASVHELCRLRLKRMPVQYVIGQWDFQDLTLKMRPPVFIPRPETEELVTHCKHILESNWSQCEQHPVFLEVGCGSGAISLALLKHFKQLQSICVEISPKACALTMDNAKDVGVEDRLHVLNEDFTKHEASSKLQAMGPYCLLVSNPPYVTAKEMESLSSEISRFEDPVALDGGQDGLDLVRHILHHAPHLLMSQGHLMLEVGEDHPRAIKDYVTTNKALGLQFVESIQDMFERDRFCHIQVPSR